MKKKESNRKMNADEIGDLAERGEDISRFFTGKGRMVPGIEREQEIQRVNVDFSQGILSD